MSSCDNYRIQWLERLESDPLRAPAGPVSSAEHGSTCATCAAWVASARVQIRLLRGLPRLELPASLERAIGADLQPDHEQVEEAEAPPFRALPALRGLARLAAPEALEARVREEFQRPASAARVSSASLLASLSDARVPGVLERLIDEELSDPAARRAERFAGNLTRLEAPTELDARVIEEMLVGRSTSSSTRRRPRQLRRVGAASAAAAAAVLLLWLSIGPGEEHESSPTRPRLRRVYAQNLSDMNPLTQGLGEALVGGLARAPRSAEARGSGPGPPSGSQDAEGEVR